MGAVSADPSSTAAVYAEQFSKILGHDHKPWAKSSIYCVGFMVPKLWDCTQNLKPSSKKIILLRIWNTPKKN